MLSSHYLFDLVDIAKFGAQSRVSLKELGALESNWSICLRFFIMVMLCYSISNKGNESFVGGTTSSISVISSLFLFKTSHFFSLIKKSHFFFSELLFPWLFQSEKLKKIQ
jgi:hypothetical protein